MLLLLNFCCNLSLESSHIQINAPSFPQHRRRGMVICHYALPSHTDTIFQHVFMWPFFTLLSDLWVFCGPTLMSRITLNSAECLRVRHRRDTQSDFCLLHTGFLFSWEEIMETERWWKNIQTCLSPFLKNFCGFFLHIPWTDVHRLHSQQYFTLLTISDQTTHNISSNYFYSHHKGLSVIAVSSVFMGCVSTVLV